MGCGVKIWEELLPRWISTGFFHQCVSCNDGLIKDAKLTVTSTRRPVGRQQHSAVEQIDMQSARRGWRGGCSPTRDGLETEITFRGVAGRASHSWAVHVSFRDSSSGVATLSPPPLHVTTLNNLNQYIHDFFLLSESFFFYSNKEVRILISCGRQK
jgi:hypothetical protein